MNFNESQTKENLARAFIAECTDGARYQFMAKDAKAKGFGFINTTLKQLAKNEMAHARVFYDFLLCGGEQCKPGDCETIEGQSNPKGCKPCECVGIDNIEVCIGLPFNNYLLPEALNISSTIEKHESADVYKQFEETALKEGFQEIAKAFHHVVQVENCHHLQLQELYNKMSKEKLYKMPQSNKWKCTNCGTEIEGKQAPEPCPFCGYPQGYYMVPLSDE